MYGMSKTTTVGRFYTCADGVPQGEVTFRVRRLAASVMVRSVPALTYTVITGRVTGTFAKTQHLPVPTSTNQRVRDIVLRIYPCSSTIAAGLRRPARGTAGDHGCQTSDRRPSRAAKTEIMAFFLG